jgi:hypothetical protein
MRSSRTAWLISQAANRAVDRPDYLAWVFSKFAKSENKAADEMAALLGVSAQDYACLGLCLRPRTASFAADIQQIASRWNMDGAALARVVRHVEVLQGMRESDTAYVVHEHGLLMAARARLKAAKKTKEAE